MAASRSSTTPAKAGTKAAPKSPAKTARKRTAAPRGSRAASPSAAQPVAPKDGRASEAPDAKSKHKLVRDSFTIPKNEYALLAELKQRSLGMGHPAKKSELLRAGIAALQAMPDLALLSALKAVPALKLGRPKDVGKR